MSRLPRLLHPLTAMLLLSVPLVVVPGVLAQSGVAQSGVAQSGVAQSEVAQSGAPSTSAELVYTVKTGDTLYRIATERGLKVEDLMKLNNLSTTDVEIGQELRLPSGTPAPTAGPAPTPPTPQVTPEPASTSPEPPKSVVPKPPVAPISRPRVDPPIVQVKGKVIGGVTVTAPKKLRMGDAFVLRLSGVRAGEARVGFSSEVGEDVRKPAELLTPIGAAGEYLVLGRVVLGKTSALTYSVRLGQEVLKGSVPVSTLDQPIQHLRLAKSLTDRLKAPARAAEEKLVEAAYARRTDQAWSRPFAPPLVSKSVSSSFGQPRTYLAGGPVAYHYGMDFPAPIGTPVKAVNDGTVVIASTVPVRGGLVVIDHGAGLVSMYFHQSKLLVRAGQQVSRGQVIGQVGTTGLSAGPHLHLEMRVRGEATLPTEYFNRLWP
jgi:murein DD-endopeptidase MepM/ murein hydrolase activator NlpD